MRVNNMGYGLKCVSQNLYTEVLTPLPQDVTVFEDKTIKEVTDLK